MSERLLDEEQTVMSKSKRHNESQDEFDEDFEDTVKDPWTNSIR